MNYHVKEYINFDNELCCDLIDMGCDLPRCFWLSAHLRDFRIFRTALAYAYQAKFYFEYFDARGIDIVERVESGSFFTKIEIQRYITHSLYRLEYSPTTDGNITKFTAKNLDNLIHTTRFTQGRVANSTTKLRINSFIAFVEFLYDHIHAGNNVPSDVLLRYNDAKGRMSRYIKKLKSGNAVVKDQFEQAIPTDVYFRLIEITKPHNSDNPWSKLSRFRNHLIVQLFNETGIRIGALCKLKISDLVTDKPTRIRITRIPHDPSDPRPRPAAQKTRAHVSAISPELMKKLLLYIDTDRGKYKNSVSHDFIFVAEKGKTAGHPLSIQSVEYLFERISKSLNFKVYPHLMRHKFQELFEDAALARGLSPERINDLRKFASGWSENSNMDEVYNEYKIAIAASEVSKEMQQSLLSNLKGLN
ncbi:site-specific integrase [Moritella sp.]|uniref:site-specific integrase n=1 Tax=Moritella sp. TaxID=78556 RepID=UPI001DC2BD71|nr:site-specific integrase [Moritella sp.]MCJ8349669.1 site-specific integrase [Moritella sp.]NQZ39845.1 site-specific integrase [Moritella sp.]